MLQDRILSLLAVLVSITQGVNFQNLISKLHDESLQRLSVVIDTRQVPLQQAQDIWHQLALRDRNLTINLFINNTESTIQATSLSEFGNLLQSVPPSLNALLYSSVHSTVNATRRGEAVLVIASEVIDDTDTELKEKEKVDLDLNDRQIKVHVIWLRKNVSQGAEMLRHLANATGGHFLYITPKENENVKSQDNTQRSRRMRWPTGENDMIQLRSDTAVTDPADLKKMSIRSNTSAQRRSGLDRADYRISNWKISMPVTVELNEQSTLFAQPGQTAILYTEITNNYEQQLFYYYYCNTMYSEVVNIQPSWGWIQGGDTVVVKVLLRVNTNLQAPYDTLLFTASGTYTVAKKIYLYFGTQTEDSNKPEVSYTVNADCSGVDQPSLCEGTSWNLQATIRDKDSGLLKVTSLPEGITLPSDFIVGTKDSVNVRYTSTCCKPKVDLIATDIHGNQYRKSIDVNNIWLSTSSIIAIVFGVILLLIIIIIIIIVIRLCIHKRRRRLSFRTNN